MSFGGGHSNTSIFFAILVSPVRCPLIGCGNAPTKLSHLRECQSSNREDKGQQRDLPPIVRPGPFLKVYSQNRGRLVFEMFEYPLYNIDQKST